MEFFSRSKQAMVDPAHALRGRETAVDIPDAHEVLPGGLDPALDPPLEEAVVGMGCFWGAERLFWNISGVVATAVGYAGGFTENPTYEEVCSGRTGHAEVVRVVFDSTKVSYRELLRVFFEGHDPTQFMGQGNDIGTQYRSAIYTFSAEQEHAARELRDSYSSRLAAAGLGEAVTEVTPAAQLATSRPFFFAEDYHQQYLSKNPNGYCGLGGTGVSCPIGLSI